MRKVMTTLSVLLLTASIALAQVESWDFSREKPVATGNNGNDGLPFGKTVYMLNVKSGLFLLGDNDWDTQGSVGETGWKVRLSKHFDKEGAWDGETVVINDSVEFKGSWMKVGCDTNQGPVCWTDCLTRHDTLWTIRKAGAHYRISASKKNPSAKTYAEDFAGVNLAEGDSRIYLNMTDEGDNCIDWQFVPEEEYHSYQKALQLYYRAETLKDLITDAEGKGLDMAVARRVYADMAATPEEIETAIVSVKKALADYDEEHVTADNPVDRTSLITNPNYEEDATGWSDTNDDLAVKYHVAEHYNDIFEHSQSIQHFPEGVYALKVQAFYRPLIPSYHLDEFLSEKNFSASIFAETASDVLATNVPYIWNGVSETPLGIGLESERTDKNGKKWYTPNNLQAAEAYFTHSELGEKYDCTLFFGVKGEAMRLGIRLDSLINSDWVLWGNWRLTYYGKQTEAYNLWLEEVKKNASRYDDAFVTRSLLEAYNRNLENLTGKDHATALAAVKTIQRQDKELEANKEAWTEYLEWTKAVKDHVTSESVYWNGCLRALDDYIKDKLPTILSERALTTEEVLQETKMMKRLFVMSPHHPSQKVWSYVSFDKTLTDETGEMKEDYSYTRYTLDGYTNIDRITYSRLVEYTTCEYEEGQETAIYHVRMEDNRIYLLKEDAPDYTEAGIILKEEGNDYILYDFNLKAGDEFCRLTYNGTDTVSVIVEETSTVTTVDGETFNTWKLSHSAGLWIEGYGSTISFLYPLTYILPSCDCGSSLNYAYWTDYHQTIAYKNPFGDIKSTSTAFKDTDCALTGADAVEEKGTIATPLRFYTEGTVFTCLSPSAIKLEVYTLDAVKAGEACFRNGEAMVKVDRVPATYLYIVTYPDGRRESGKVMVK